MQRRVPVRKAAEIQAEKWLKAGLPKGHGLAPTRVMAAQIATLAEALLAILRTQQERYARYIEDAPAGAGAHPQGRHQGPAAGGPGDVPLPGSRASFWGREPGETARFALDKAELSAALHRGARGSDRHRGRGCPAGPGRP